MQRILVERKKGSEMRQQSGRGCFVMMWLKINSVANFCKNFQNFKIAKFHKFCGSILISYNLATSARGGVNLEFDQNSLYSIRKFAIRLIRKGKKYSKNSMKINSKFV